MANQHQYWVVSPNVINQEKIVRDWKEEILHARAAIMGWSPDNYEHGQIGPKFAGKTDRSIQPGDIVLIARRHNWAPEVVGFGVVKGECREDQLSASNHRVYLRDLEPFKPLRRALKGIPVLEVLQHTSALVQLHPDQEKNNAAWKVCKWMNQQLGLEDQEVDNDDITEVDLPQSTTFGYNVKNQHQVTRARKREAKLLKDYEQWLAKQGRQLSALKYNRVQCDAWEKERRNLIEAKSSTRLEDIRMAVGQLLDYAFQGEEIFDQPHMAILLPAKPDHASVKWLAPLCIKMIWRRGQSFLDNANGQFT